MLPEATTGISVMGDVPWGKHFCYFFETKQDLLDVSVPFFQAGLENNEFCLWIVYTPVTKADAVGALRRSIPGLDRYLAEGGMEIRVHTEPLFDSLVGGGALEARSSVQHLHEKLDDALARGYVGMRVAGSPACLQKADTGHFREFERELGRSAANLRMIALCHFPLAESSAAEILDAARTHQFVAAMRQGNWEIIETPEIKLTKAEITKLNEQLEQRVEERIRALETANEELRKEIARRERVEEDLRRQKEILETIFDHIPVMINFMDQDGQFKLVNREWERTLGWSLAEIRSQNIDIVEKNYPDPEYREKVRDFVRNSNAEWADFKTTVRDGRVIDTSWAMLHFSDGTGIGIGQDITERKQVEEALRESEERFRQLAENIQDLFWIKTADFKRVLYLSPVYESMSGRSRENRYRDRDYQPFLDRIVPDDRERMAAIMRSGSGAEYDIEFRIARSDGSVRWIRDRGFPIRDQSGQVYRIAGIANDITERKLAEEALRESEERFRQIAENIREVFWLRSPDLKQLLYVSPMYEKVCGRTRESLYAGGPELVVHPEDRSRVIETLQSVAGREFEIEYRIITKDGDVRWICDRGFPIRDESGQICRIAGIADDITERRLAENALRESEERFRQIAENIHEVFWLTTPDLSRILYLSPSFRNLIGRPFELEDQNAGIETFLKLVHPDDLPRVMELMQRPGEEFDIEIRIKRDDGSVRWLRDRGFPVRDESGAVCRIGGVVEDITNRKEAEDRLKASSEQLRALSGSLQSARETEATRIAHQIHDELGGLLTGLRWELEALEKMILQAGDAEQLQAMRDRLTTMLGLTDTTINVVRRIASELRPSILDDLGLMEAIEWQTQQFQARTGIQCHCDCALPSIALGDQQSTAVFRIVQEALTNILRHAQATQVGVAMKQEHGAFILTVTDDGRGITPAEVLSRASLGILGMQERAHLIGGRVDIVGLKGTGTTLYVRVPLSGREPGGAP